MLDGVMRRMIDPALDRLGGWLARRGIRPDQVSIAGAASAIVCGLAVAQGAWLLALLMLAFSRLCDGLDGAIARHVGMTDFGGYLDIICDFIFYAAVPVGFAWLDASEATAAAVLLASFYLNAASFLGFAVLAERRGLTTEVRGKKTLYFTTGLAEGTETIAVFVAMLLVPSWFSPLAYGFAALCLVTCAARVWHARALFAAKDGA